MRFIGILYQIKASSLVWKNIGRGMLKSPNKCKDSWTFLIWPIKSTTDVSQMLFLKYLIELSYKWSFIHGIAHASLQWVKKL